MITDKCLKIGHYGAKNLKEENKMVKKNFGTYIKSNSFSTKISPAHKKKKGGGHRSLKVKKTTLANPFCLDILQGNSIIP